MSHYGCCLHCSKRTDSPNRVKYRVIVNNTKWLQDFFLSKNVDLTRYHWICKECYDYFLKLENGSVLNIIPTNIGLLFKNIDESNIILI